MNAAFRIAFTAAWWLLTLGFRASAQCDRREWQVVGEPRRALPLLPAHANGFIFDRPHHETRSGARFIAHELDRVACQGKSRLGHRIQPLLARAIVVPKQCAAFQR